MVGCAGDAPAMNLFLRQLALERETRKLKKYEEEMLSTPMCAGDRTLEMDHDGPRLKEIFSPLPRIMKCERDYQERLIKENRKQSDDHKRKRDLIDRYEPDFKRAYLNSATSNLADLDVSNNSSRKRNNGGNICTIDEKRMRNESRTNQ